MKARRLTIMDDEALDRISNAGGFVGFEGSKPYLETSQMVTTYRVHRLYQLGYLEVSGQPLIPGEPPQSYKVAKHAKA